MVHGGSDGYFPGFHSEERHDEGLAGRDLQGEFTAVSGSDTAGRTFDGYGSSRNGLSGLGVHDGSCQVRLREGDPSRQESD